MNIPPLNISITKAATNGQVVDVITYEEYGNNNDLYKDRKDVAIPITAPYGKEVLLPLKGKYTSCSVMPGIYDAGCIDFIVYPEEDFSDRYVAKEYVTMSNTDAIGELIKANEAAKKLDEPFITSPDSITNIPIRDNDQPEMKALKMALNAKNINIDKYASRFGDNYPNDKRQLKNNNATLKIIKRFCENCDMDAILTFKDKNENVPNPMNTEISVSLTDIIDSSDDIYNSSEESDE